MPLPRIGQAGTYLLELLNGTLVDTTALVDEMAGGGRLARVDVADDDNIDMSLLLLTVGQDWSVKTGYRESWGI